MYIFHTPVIPFLQTGHLRSRLNIARIHSQHNKWPHLVTKVWYPKTRIVSIRSKHTLHATRASSSVCVATVQDVDPVYADSSSASSSPVRSITCNMQHFKNTSPISINIDHQNVININQPNPSRGRYDSKFTSSTLTNHIGTMRLYYTAPFK